MKIPPPYTSDQSEAVKDFNAEARAQHAAGATEPDMSEEDLLATARRETGLECFGDERFMPDLRELLKALETEAQLNPFGRARARACVLGPLKNRLWANACFEAHPEILERTIEAPICIIGAHRSGTTRMHRMMACDPRLQHLTTWEGYNPAPRPGQPELGKAARYREVAAALDLRQRMYPDGIHAHPMHPSWPEEEMLLLNHTFLNFQFFALFSIPGFYKYFRDADKTHAYEYMARLMKLVAWSRGEPGGRRWVLKNPQHMMDLDTLLKVFPDAKLVFPHRDPLKTVASTISLCWLFARQHSDRPLRGATREVWYDFCLQAARRCMRVRETLPGSQQLDVYYKDMNRDWRGVMRRVYQFSGLEFTAEAEQALAAWLANSERENLHGGHRYSLEDFGLASADVDASMMFVRERYAIPYE